MAAADTAKLVAQLILDAKGFSKGINKADKDLGKLESTAFRVGQNIGRGTQAAIGNIAKIGVVAAGAITTQVVAGINSLQELETALNATEGVIKSTGGAAGVTAQQVRDLAESLENTTTADDKAIQGAENLLLTFTNIGKDAFPQATKAVIDLGIAMAEGDVANADFKASAIQIGKALNSPTKGITALTRVGVSFTAQQKKQIAALEKSGDILGAQTIILNELEKEFGEAGRAAGTGFGADMRRVGDAVEGAQQALAKGFLPVITKVAKILNEKLADPKTIAAIESFGVEAAAGLESLISAASKLPWDAIGQSLKLGGQGAKAILDAFVALPPWVQTAVLTGWGLNKLTGGAIGGIVGELGKGLIKGVLGMTAGVVNINAGVVNGVGGPAAAASTAAGAATAAGGIGALGLATAVAVPVVLAGGAVVSLNAIADEAAENNRLAAKGLTAAEITAQKFYTANKADQDRIFKQLHGRIPPREVFESGTQKLMQVSREEAFRIRDGVNRSAGIIQTATNAVKAAVNATALAAQHAGQQTAAAIRDKDLSVANYNSVTVNNRVSVQETIKTQTTFKQFNKFIS